MRLIAAKCPSCGANVRIDLERELATCDYCKASSFVQTNKRRATEEIRQQHPLVIDAGASRRPLVPAALGIGLGAVVIAGLALVVARAGARVESPPTPPPSKPAAVLPEPKPPEPKPPEPSAPSQPAPKLSPAELAKLQKSATVRYGALTISGKLTMHDIHGRLRTLRDRFLGCYREGLSRTPTLSGRITLKFVIGTNGAISSIDQSPPAFSDEFTARCVIAALTPLTFPKPAGPVTVQYPLLLRTD